MESRRLLAFGVLWSHSVNVAFGAPLEIFIFSCGQECGVQEKESAVKTTAIASTA
jgi:hypothetical protein